MIDWMTELIGVPSKEYPRFMAGLSFLAAPPPDGGLNARRTRAEALSFGLAGLRGSLRATRDVGLPRLFGLEAEYEEQQLESELQFVNALVKDIASGNLGGMDLWNAFHTEGAIPFEGVTFIPDHDA